MAMSTGTLVKAFMQVLAALFINTYTARSTETVVGRKAVALSRDSSEVSKRLKASDITDASDIVQPTEEMKKVAGEIAKWCLWRWDGFLGFRAGSDSVGRRAGVWKDKFESVRCAVLLAAMASLNHTLCDNVTLNSRSDDSGCLMSSWQVSRKSRQKQSLVDLIAVILQDITADEAEALPKDPERLPLHYRLAAMMPRLRSSS